MTIFQGISQEYEKFVQCLTVNKSSKNVGLLDSGSSNHTCCLKYIISTIRPYESVIKVGDGRKLEVKGICEVQLETITNGQSNKI